MRFVLAGSALREARPRRRRLLAVVRCAIALAILAWLFHAVSPASVLDAAASAAPAPCSALSCSRCSRTWWSPTACAAWSTALGMRLSTLNLLQINLATVFYGLILPAGNVTGIIARFYRMSRREPNYAAIAVALAFERVVTTLTLCLVGIAFWLVDWPADWLALVLMLGALAAPPGAARRVVHRAAAGAGPAARPPGALVAGQADVAARGAPPFAGPAHGASWRRCSSSAS